MKRLITLLFAATLLFTFSCKSDLDKSIEKEVEKETIVKTDVTITWENPEDIFVGTELSETQLNATADESGTFVYTPSLGTVLSVGTHDLTVDFTPNDTTYYNTATATVTINVLDLNIGDSYQGGILAYIFQDGDPGFVSGEIHGLIASNEDLTVDNVSLFTWYNSLGDIFTTDATSTELGTGLSNTNLIIDAQEEIGVYAALVCFNYVSDGYDDWFLPSRDELLKIDETGELTPAYDYWSSSEYDNGLPAINDLAYIVDSGGTAITKLKSLEYKVRAARYF